MRRVINWQDYKDNWQDWTDCIMECGIDALVAVLMLCVFLVLFIPVTVLVTSGYAPNFEDGEHDRG